MNNIHRELMERDVERAKGKMMEKESSSTTTINEDSSPNDQLVVKSYVDAIIDRTKLLLYVTMAADDPSTPLTSDYKGELFQIKHTIDFLKLYFQNRLYYHQLLVHLC